MAVINERLLELSVRYLQRSGDEVSQLREQSNRFAAGELAALKEIEVIAHRIRGSGAMFGFAAISDVAGELEMLADDPARLSPQFESVAAQLAALVESVDAAVRDAQRQSNGQSNERSIE